MTQSRVGGAQVPWVCILGSGAQAKWPEAKERQRLKPVLPGSRRRKAAPTKLLNYFCELGGDGVVAFKGFLDHLSGNRAFPADAPMLAAQLDNGGGHKLASITRVEN